MIKQGLSSLSSAMGSLLLSSQQSLTKRQKVVVFYELFFEGLNPSETIRDFWDDFFLLEPNTTAFIRLAHKKTRQEMSRLKPMWANLLLRCLEACKDTTAHRQANALATMNLLFMTFSSKKFISNPIDIVHFFSSLERIHEDMQMLMFAIHETLLDKDPQVRKRALYLACTLATSVDNIHECIFNDYLMIHSIFQPILKLIIDPSVSSLAFDAMVLLSILSNYKKYETINPYLSNLSKIKDTRILKFLASLVMETFWKCRLSVEEKRIKKGIPLPTSRIHASIPKSITLPHYRLITLFFYDLLNNNAEFVRVICSSSKINPLLSDLYEPNRISETSRRSETPIGGGTRMGTTSTEFIGFTHILFACYPSVDNALYSKTALLIFTAMLENKSICETLLTEQFYTMPLRLGKHSFVDQEEPELMLHAILDAISIFLLHNLKKSISMDLYTTALDVLQRIILLAFQTRKRLFYDWPKLWNGLMTLSRFWASNKKHVVSYASSEMLVRKISTILNLVIIHGDTFLGNVHDYYHLFFEIIRNAESMTVLSTMYTPLQSTSVHSLRKYVSLEPSSYSNILLISNHFLTHVKDVGSSNTLVPKDIISLIQEHFETLELRPVKGLDYVQPYHENPGETQFFRLFQRQVSAEWKDNVRSRVLNL